MAAGSMKTIICGFLSGFFFVILTGRVFSLGSSEACAAPYFFWNIPNEDKDNVLSSLRMPPNDSLKYEVIFHGDTNAYSELSNQYIAHSFTGEDIAYSMFMANYYNYTYAGYMTYVYLFQIFNNDDKALDACTRKLMEMYADCHHRYLSNK